MDNKKQARLNWVKMYLETKDAGLVCRRCGISRPTLRKWLKRYKREFDYFMSPVACSS